jgi:hypothetical protein
MLKIRAPMSDAEEKDKQCKLAMQYQNYLSSNTCKTWLGSGSPYLNDMIDGLLRTVNVQPDYLAVQSVGFIHLKGIIVNLFNTGVRKTREKNGNFNFNFNGNFCCGSKSRFCVKTAGRSGSWILIQTQVFKTKNRTITPLKISKFSVYRMRSFSI